MRNWITPNGSPGPNADGDAAVALSFTYRLRFTRDALDPENHMLTDVMPAARDDAARVLVAIDAGVETAQPDVRARVMTALDHAADHLTVAEIITVPGGEAAKNDDAVVQTITQAIHEHGLCRHSYVVTIGGGAVLDAVGFAAATAHRGVRLVRLPTTTLAQGDAGIGVKNGINAFGKKNFLGTFTSPWAVINDTMFLTTLSDRDWRCGFSEAVKVALVRDGAFFEQIEQQAQRIAARDLAASRPIVQRCAELHLQHIVEGGDPFELTTARPLDFGHWSAHKLEQMSDYRIRHGEAVAIGVALDVLYAAAIGLLSETDADRVLRCLSELGFELFASELRDTNTLFEGIEEFREHLGGRLTIALIDRLGRQRDVHEIDRGKMAEAIDQLEGRAAAEPRR